MANIGRPKKTEQVLLEMRTGFSYQTASGVKFTKAHPFQLVLAHEVESLLVSGRFKRASADDVKLYYGLQED